MLSFVINYISDFFSYIFRRKKDDKIDYGLPPSSPPIHSNYVRPKPTLAPYSYNTPRQNIVDRPYVRNRDEDDTTDIIAAIVVAEALSNVSFSIDDEDKLSGGGGESGGGGASSSWDSDSSSSDSSSSME